MQIKLRTLLLVLPLVVASCSDPFDTSVRPAGTISVSVGSDPRLGIRSDSRTSIESDGQTIRWNTGDKIALWAVNTEGGQPIIAGQAFELWHYNASFNAAKFTANVPALPEGTYNYYALSPLPASINGTKATYSLPAVQEFKTAELGQALTNLPYDIMVADPVEGKALVEGDNSDVVNLAFRHKVHLLKVTVESNSLGQKVSEVVLTFPSPVVGTLTIDAANPNAEPVLTNSSNTLIIRFDEPVEPGTTVIAAIAPIDVPTSENVQIVSYGETHESQIRNIPGKNFAAGRTTPLFYNIPTQGREFTRLSFSLPADKGTSTLGETITRIKLTAPENEMLGLSSVLEFTPNAEGKHSIYLKPLWQDISGAKIAVEYESESAVVSNTLTMPQITANAENNIPAFSVPYLMAEDFSSVTTFSDNEGTKGINDPAAIWLPGLSGWSAARVGGVTGKSVRIVGHREGGLFVFVDYEARMDSAPLSGLKEGATVTIKVSFNYSGSTNKGAPKFRYGVSTAQGALNGTNTGVETQIADISASTNGSYDRIDKAITPFTTSGTKNTRIAWVAYGSDGGFSGSYFYYIYIDNIKVSIVQ